MSMISEEKQFNIYSARQMKYGGHGYSHILKNVIPKMRCKGLSETIIQKILVENPKRWLTFK